MSIEIQSKAFATVTTGGYAVKTSALSDELAGSGTGTTQSLASQPIQDHLAGEKRVVEFVVETAFSNVAATLIMEGSLTGTEWVTLPT